MNFDEGETILNDADDSQQKANPYLSEGTRLGDYELLQLLGAGAMGEVYLARQVNLDQKCAIKILPQKFSQSADFEQRFIAEGRVLAKMDHPNVVRVMYAGKSDKWHYLTMEYVDGGSLEDYISKNGGKLPETEIRSIMSDILSGLSYAHKQGIVHRDLKPANILRTKDGHCKISDFGLATVAGKQYVQEIVRKSMRAQSADKISSIETDATIVEGSDVGSAVQKSRSVREVVGTFNYISPEVLKTGKADATSDIYAVGIMAYQMLAGQIPGAMAKLPSKIVKGISVEWDNWVSKCMESDPKDRFQSADDALAEMPLPCADSGKSGGVRPAKKSSVTLVIASIVVACAVLAAIGVAVYINMAKDRPIAPAEPPIAHPQTVSKADAASETKTHSAQSTPLKAPQSDVTVSDGRGNVAGPGALSKPQAKTEPAKSPTKTEPAHSSVEAPQLVTPVKKPSPAVIINKNNTKDMFYADGPKPKQPWTVPDVALEMIWIGEGRFDMGSPTTEQGRSGDEGPKHRVTISKGFWLGKFEVTQGQWKKLMGGNPSKFANGGDEAPVENVSWDDAKAFCEELTRREHEAHRLPDGYEYSLPTEAQWEYACRAGSSSRYSGADVPGDISWFSGNSVGATHPVGKKTPNAWGLFDMHGNVGEWCYDFGGPYSDSAAADPTGPATGAMRIFRGGGYNSDAGSCRSAYRNRRVPSYAYGNLGFRVALVPVRE